MSFKCIRPTLILKSLLVTNIVLGVFSCVGASALAQPATNPALDHWNRIVALNTLTAEGNIPFYLKIEFQIFDLKGKPGETGTAEVWWSQHRRYQVIASPSWNETSAPGEPHQPQTRQSYLIQGLIEQIIHPASAAKPSPALKIDEADRKFGSTLLRCLSMNAGFATICVNPGSDELRMNSQGSATVVRDKMGKFQTTEVALDLTTTYGAYKAIAGKVVALNSIPADDEHIKPSPEPVPQADSPNRTAASGVRAGRKIGGAIPVYPEALKAGHISGSVTIIATITKEGKIASPIVLATANSLLDAAALDVVRTWKYEPYLLNGQPVDVDTLIIINFGPTR